MSGATKRSRLSRRAFLASAGVLTVGAALGGGYAALSGAPNPLSGRVVNAFVAIWADGTVQCVCPAQDLGQGAPMAMTMILAEEIGADLARTEIIAAPRDASTYGNPDFAGRMVTADSKTTRGYYPVLRLAGAEARMALIATACRQREWAAADCRTEQHAVLHPPSGERMSFAEIAALEELTLPGGATERDLKRSDMFTLVGSSPADPRHLDIVTGRKKFGVDQRPQGGLIAILARSPHLGGAPVAVNDRAAKAIAGVEAVVKLDDAVAVVARNTWSALRGREALVIEWTPPSDFSDKHERKMLEEALDKKGAGWVDCRKSGEPPIEADLVAEFYAPCLTHLIMEPLNATAQGRSWGLGVEIRSATQSLDLDMRYGAKTWKTAPFMVETTATPTGGAYGRRVLNDAVAEAAEIAKQVGKPVQVIRPMRDELQRGQVRPAAAQRIAAALSKEGALVGWRHDIASDGTLATHLPSSLKGPDKSEDNTATDGVRHPYRVPSERLRWRRVRSAPTPGFLRGVSAGYTVWAIEATVERLARKAGRDPKEWRQAHLQDERVIEVMNKAAEMAGWGAAGRVFGLGVMQFRGSSVATVAEVAGAKLAGLWIAADVGRVVHRDKVLAQIEGGAVWGVSMALRERLSYADGRAEIDSFVHYPTARLADLPPIRIELAAPKAEDPPFGVGEIGIPTTVAAIANGFEAAMGRTFSELPLAVS
ncbi:MAG: molybdopterin-dependent oxidoreductase [Neomegalonema sp.]|nr:molybdopterin-dependent oxidoreductase [Neomegalonema sp.]